MDRDERMATLEANGRWQNQMIEETRNDVREIRSDVRQIKESHLSFKWKIVGASASIGFIFSLIAMYLGR